MERYNYKRNALHSLLVEDDLVLARRYLKKNQTFQQKLVDAFNEVVNIREENTNTFKYGAVACLDGACLDYIFAEVFEKINPIIMGNGYQFKIENIVADLNRVLNDNAVIVLQARKDRTKVSPLIKEIVEDYVYTILTDKVLTAVFGNKVSID